MERRSTFGMGSRSGWAVSIRASTHEPSSMRSAKSLSCPMVRPDSPRILASGRPVSSGPLAAMSSMTASMLLAIARRNVAFSGPDLWR